MVGVDKHAPKGVFMSIKMDAVQSHLAAVMARPVQLEAGISTEQGFTVILANCLRQVQDNQIGVARGTAPESLHQMRVGLRRLLSAMRLFARWIPLPADLRQDLRWLGDQLGAARDADVLANSTLQKVAPASSMDAAWVQLTHAASIEARMKRQLAAAAVGSARYSHLTQGLQDWVQATRWSESVDQASRQALSEPLEQHAARLMARSHRRLLKRAQGVADGARHRHHRVRIAAKQARYAAEFFQSLQAPKDASHYARKLTALQDTLGWINDAEVADRLLNDTAHVHPELSGSASWARRHLRALITHDMRSLPRRCRALSALKPPRTRS
jgi:triphosphatase